MKMCKNKLFSGGLLLALIYSSLIGVGFSGRITSNKSEETQIDVSIGSLQTFDYKNCAYYVQNSETGFNYYIYNHKYYFTKNTLTIDFKINPSYFSSKFDDEDVVANFGISYLSANDENYFNGSCSYITPPTLYKSFVKGKYTNYFESDDLEYSERTTSSGKDISLTSSICLYSKCYKSISNLAKYYQKNNEYIEISVEFEFLITNGITPSQSFLETKFRIFTSLGV